MTQLLAGDRRRAYAEHLRMSAENAFTNGRGLHAQLMHELGQRIAAGELDGSEPLVPDEIGRRFGVSRTVVRETLRVLQSKGMLRARQNVGTYVQPVREWNLLDPDVIRWRLSGEQARENMRELIELRTAVEPQAAFLAAGRADEPMRQRLVDAVGDMEAASRAGDFDAFTEADVRFHSTLLGASGNIMIEQLASTIAVALRARESTLAIGGGVSSDALADHRLVAEAVVAGDAAAARSAMRALLDVGTRDVDAALRARERSRGAAAGGSAARAPRHGSGRGRSPSG
jgi:DNA-binding FadR family transcriptional regulator